MWWSGKKKAKTCLWIVNKLFYLKFPKSKRKLFFLVSRSLKNHSGNFKPSWLVDVGALSSQEICPLLSTSSCNVTVGDVKFLTEVCGCVANQGVFSAADFSKTLSLLLPACFSSLVAARVYRRNRRANLDVWTTNLSVVWLSCVRM